MSNNKILRFPRERVVDSFAASSIARDKNIIGWQTSAETDWELRPIYRDFFKTIKSRTHTKGFTDD